MAGATANAAQTAHTRETAPAGALAPVVVREIELEGRARRVDPPFRFNVSFNEAEGFYESIEEGGHNAMYLADDTPDRFEAILREIVLPGLWEEYALAGDEELSTGALALKRLLLERIA